MRYIKYTYVDAVTGVPVTTAPASNGPAQPPVDGLEFGFALESQYPTLVPTHYGTCPDESDINVPGVLAELTQAQYLDANTAEMLARIEKSRQQLLAAATAKRWSVMTGGITLPNGVSVGTMIDDQNRITSVVANASLAGLTDASQVDFKASSGWVTVTIAEVKAIAGVIGQFVQACYTAERAHHEAIALLADTQAIADYDMDAGWPAV